MIQNVNNFVRDAGYSLNGVRQSALAYDAATARLETIHIGRTRILLVSNEAPFAWSYLPGSDLKSSLTYPNGLTASWTFDSNNQMLQVCNAAPTNVISQYDYTYDSAGRRVACGKSGSAFAQNDTLSYGYNEKSELTNAVAAVDSDYRYSYAFDDIGNRETSSERGTNSVYAANQLNQYTAVDDFTPEFDDDGNQTLVKTATGIWSVTYNGENRPILWTCTQSDNPSITNNQTISMSYDRMGRRVTKNAQRFVYDGYLQIANFEHQTSNIKLQTFVWDPTEPVATRPLVWHVLRSLGEGGYYTHDANKNVSEVVAENGDVCAHYDYAPFGAVTSAVGDSANANVWRLSSEYADTDLGLVYYNYRYYDPKEGRWLSLDVICQINEYFYLKRAIDQVDVLGAKPLDAWGWNWYDFVVWYWLGRGKAVDLSNWYQLGAFKKEISNSIDSLKQRVISSIVIPGCNSTGHFAPPSTSGNIGGLFRLNSTASSWLDAIGDANKVLNQGRLTVSYKCSFNYDCECCEKTSRYYRTGGYGRCTLKFMLSDRFANPTDQEDIYADNYERRERCISNCRKRFSLWDRIVSPAKRAEYKNCLDTCDRSFPSTELVGAVPYAITAEWTDQISFTIKPEACK